MSADAFHQFYPAYFYKNRNCLSEKADRQKTRSIYVYFLVLIDTSKICIYNLWTAVLLGILHNH